MIESIYSIRSFQSWPSFDLIYEWEAEIARTLSIPLKTPGKLSYKLHNLCNRISDRLKPERKRTSRRLRFVLSATLDNSESFSSDDVPVIVDYFLNQEETTAYISQMSRFPLVLVTSAGL